MEKARLSETSVPISTRSDQLNKPWQPPIRQQIKQKPCINTTNFFLYDVSLFPFYLTTVGLTFSLLPIRYTNFLFIYTNYIKLNSSTCFERNPPIIRSPSLAVAQDSHLQRVTIPEAAYVQFAPLTS